MNALKIGVLTFHRCINYGSYWQAISLVAGLRQKGHEAYILDHHSKRVNRAEWKCGLQPVLPTPVPPGDMPLYREKIQRFFQVFEHMPLSKKFVLEQPETMDTYDLIVVGSDEVWNLAHPWYGSCPIFYGEGLNAPLLVSYAASFGNYDAAWGLEPQWAARLRNFDMISVRDENSKNIVRNAIDMKPEVVLDPCLQFHLEPSPRELNHLPRAYIAVYGHNFSPAFSVHISSYARARNLPLISIGYRNDWADEQWITADPHDYAHFIANCTALATNFFHGCVFALRNAKSFVCETTVYRSIKVESLMQSIGGLNHLVNADSDYGAYEQALSNPVAAYILNRLEQLRQSSDAFLDRALDLKQYQYA